MAVKYRSSLVDVAIHQKITVLLPSHCINYKLSAINDVYFCCTQFKNYVISYALCEWVSK